MFNKIQNRLKFPRKRTMNNPFLLHLSDQSIEKENKLLQLHFVFPHRDCGSSVPQVDGVAFARRINRTTQLHAQRCPRTSSRAHDVALLLSRKRLPLPPRASSLVDKESRAWKV